MVSVTINIFLFEYLNFSMKVFCVDTPRNYTDVWRVRPNRRRVVCSMNCRLLRAEQKPELILGYGGSFIGGFVISVFL